MFIQILFDKLKLKKSKWAMALAYAAAYMIIFLIILEMSQFFLGLLNQLRIIRYSLMLFIVMFLVYIIKYEVFEFMKEANKKN